VASDKSRNYFITGDTINVQHNYAEILSYFETPMFKYFNFVQMFREYKVKWHVTVVSYEGVSRSLPTKSITKSTTINAR
jgi:hypothetical protein